MGVSCSKDDSVDDHDDYKNIDVDYKQSMLIQLYQELAMGTKDECIIALQKTKYKGIDEAIEWLINHQSPSKVMENESISQCKMDETKDCNCYKRLLSVMEKYNEWIDSIHKQQSSTNMNDEFLKVLNELNNNYNCNYSISQILNDYFHFKNNHNKDLQSMQCNGIECILFARNMRNRDIYCSDNKKRSKVYFTNSSESVGIQQIFDIIHQYLYHQKQNDNINVSKFVTNINDTMDNKDNDNIENMTEYSFGVNFMWHEMLKQDYIQREFYVKPKYESLYEELTMNGIYNLSKEQFNDTMVKAKEFINTFPAKNITVFGSPRWCHICDMKQGENLKLYHMIAILCYTNFDELQRRMKQTFRVTPNEEYSRSAQYQIMQQNNCNFGIWCKYIFEIIFLFGTKTTGMILYHGIDKIMIFSQMNAWFRAPTSTTTSPVVAQTFSLGDNGCILALKSDEIGQYRQFDVSLFSDYPQEYEVLIMKSKWTFYDILIGGNSNKDWIEALKFLQCLLMGGLIENQWNDLSEFVLKLIQSEMRINGDDNDDNVIDDELAPNYISLLLQSFIEDNTDILTRDIWLNLDEIENNLDKKLIPYFYNSDNDKNYGYFIEHLHNKYKKLIKCTVKFIWKISGNEKVMFDGLDVNDSIHKLFNYKDIVFKMYLYKFTNWWDNINEGKNCAFAIFTESLPDNIQTIDGDFILRCPEIGYLNKLGTTKCSQLDDASIFAQFIMDRSSIEDLDEFTVELYFKQIKTIEKVRDEIAQMLLQQFGARYAFHAGI